MGGGSSYSVGGNRSTISARQRRQEARAREQRRNNANQNNNSTGLEGRYGRGGVRVG